MYILFFFFVVFNLTVETTPLKEDTLLPFENREKELEKMLEACIQNQLYSKQSTADPTVFSQIKPVLVTSCQMWGSGKSYFGRHFLAQLRTSKMQSFITKKIEETKQYPDLMNNILQAKYLLVDFRAATSKELCQDGITKYLVLAFAKYYPKSVDELDGKKIGDWSIENIISVVKKSYPSYFFFSL